MIAPLRDSCFNKAKSDIKFIESALLGIPVLLQDLVTYSSAPPEIKFKTMEEFEAKVEERLNFKNKKRYYNEVEWLNSFAQTRILELPQNIGCFYEAYMTPYGDPRRNHLKRYNT
jgi:hypothetical protein